MLSRDLLQRLQGENVDEGAWDQLYRDHLVPRIRSLRWKFYSLSTEDIEDLMQETFVRLFKHRREIDAEKFDGLVFTITKHMAIDYLKKRHSQVEFQDVQLEVERRLDALRHQDLEGRSADRFALIERGIQSLPKEDRRVLNLFYFHEMKVEQVADVTLRTPLSVNMRIFRAHKKLRVFMENSGETPGPRLSQDGQKLGRKPGAKKNVQTEKEAQ